MTNLTLSETSRSSVVAASPAELPFKIMTRPGLVVGLLVLCDLCMLAAAAVTAVCGPLLLETVTRPSRYLDLYLDLWPLLGVFIAAYGCLKLYPALPLSPANELRRLTIVTSLIYLGLGTVTFLFQEGITYSRSVLLIAWAASLVTVPVGRASLRMMLSSRHWWGYAVVVLGAGKTARQVIRTLQRQTEIGLKPVAVVDDRLERGPELLGVPVIGNLDLLEDLGRRHCVPYAILALADLPPGRARELRDRLDRSFHHLMVIPHMSGFSSLWVSPIDLGGVLGLELRHRLLDPGRRFLKSLLDLGLIIVCSPVFLVIVALIALAIKLDSRGAVFYGHERIGYGGRRFTIWKFRTMHRKADRILARYLRHHPELREEWQRTHKLKNDPRITFVGRLLRKTSLDELPQVWNVVMGQMSLVGPRPIIEEEVEKYRDDFLIYVKVKPGITGLWQVSGRNNVGYDDRVRMDVYYVRNWSVWLDIYLLSRTALAVLLCRGAY